MLGKLGHFSAMQGKDETWDKIASEGARTVPGRENGGNCDIKNLSRGSTLYLPVFVPGAKLSMGGRLQLICLPGVILVYFFSP
jgi:formamidase